jgi:uncharacterized protein YndB with AHSA1/START domain
MAEDRIEKQVTLRAPVSRVWRALIDAEEFGRWFGIRLDGPFVEGHTVAGTFAGRFTEDDMARFQRAVGLTPGKVRIPQGSSVFCTVERIDPERYFSFRWIPFGIDAEVDPATEPSTLVEFTLEAAGDGTRLTIVESGFDRVPQRRRERAFRMNTGGWASQADNLRKYVENV